MLDIWLLSSSLSSYAKKEETVEWNHSGYFWKVIEGKLLKNQNTQIMCPWAFFCHSKGQMTWLLQKVSPPTSSYFHMNSVEISISKNFYMY